MEKTIKSGLDWEQNTPQILGLLMVLFLIYKLFHVGSPLFHDELEVYGRALYYMIDNGPTLIPGSMDTDLSRGHPLFFVFFMSLITKVLGGSYVVARILALLMSLGLILSTYYLGKEMFNKKIGFLAAVLLIFQPLFITQSTMILPEMMLALLGVLSLLFYIQKKYLPYFLFSSLLILTKETGIILFAGIVLNEWYKDRFRISFSLIVRAIKWSAPLSCFILFLIVQKIQLGWYLYPYHTEFISFEVEDIAKRFLLGAKHLFYDQGRFMILTLILIDVLKMTRKQVTGVLGKNFITLSVLLMFFVFSSLNFFMARYQLIVLPLLMIFTVTFLSIRPNNYKHFLLYIALTIPYLFNYKTFSTDNNMSYQITVQNMQNSIAKLDSICDGEPVRVFAILPEYHALLDPRFGYTTNPNYILYNEYNDSCSYILRGSHNLYDPNALRNSPIDTLLNNRAVLNSSAIEQIYNSQLYFSQQKIFCTNNKN
ncbi:glycosyltransferase family 39 protein [Aureispira]|nr:glycosyltransferase family 39 protein [Aureispira sp.]